MLTPAEKKAQRDAVNAAKAAKKAEAAAKKAAKQGGGDEPKKKKDPKPESTPQPAKEVKTGLTMDKKDS